MIADEKVYVVVNLFMPVGVYDDIQSLYDNLIHNHLFLSSDNEKLPPIKTIMESIEKEERFIDNNCSDSYEIHRVFKL